ncbi:trimeric intracellular cation channel type B [Salminus brasiliensis]|uniref:trimeric intracellular cation channel type B n=1 Tax=Salminus brasiliensis TaxID=930266 RepID=UPI003B834EC1
MDLLGLGTVKQLAEGLAGLPMFPYFDTAHYIVSVMALREQPGALEVSRRSPFACWFSSMLYCFGGAVLSGIILAEAPVAPLANSTNVLLASLMWYLVFYCPLDAVYSCAAVLPVRLVLTGMKEVTRTWKVLGGVTQASKKYENGLFVMIAVGWAKGAGGGLISNFEQLVRGIWKPETNELLKMSYPTKVTLMGAVLFSLQQCRYLPLRTPDLMLIYTVFIVVNKTRMMLLGSSSSPFDTVESALYQTLFARPLTYSPLTNQSQSSTRTPSCPAKPDSKSAPGVSNGLPQTEDQPDCSESESSKKTN